MPHTSARVHLTPPVNPSTDHILGEWDAEITLVEYGSYACPFCRAANERIADLRDEFGDRIRYVFRHRPIPDSDIAYRAAVLAEQAAQIGRFWEMHSLLMTRSAILTEDDLRAAAFQFGLPTGEDPAAAISEQDARKEVDTDIRGARESGVKITPSFYINGRKYEGLWEESAFKSALVGSMGHRMRSATLDFARWAPGAGLLLLLTTILAIVLTNSPFGPRFTAFWQTPLGVSLNDHHFRLTLLEWVNDGLLSIFFLVVGLEIKREFTVGHLSTRRSAALPVAAAIGGMIAPAVLYFAIVGRGAWAHGWGIPIGTDTAFAIALIVMLGRRVPVELRIFLTACAIVDDIGAIIVVALFYSSHIHLGFLLAAAAAIVVLALMNRVNIYRPAPYVWVGLLLWFLVHAGGLHATLAGVLLALFIPTREPPNYRALMSQADAILVAEARHSGEALRHGPSATAMSALDAIHNRMESPADRMLRVVSLRSNYLVLPIFALANAGVALSAHVVSGHEPLIAAVVVGLVAGKPLGIISASWLAARLGVAEKPEAYSWTQLIGAGVLSGIGFTMSLFIAGRAFSSATDFAAAKIAVFTASIIAAIAGATILLLAGHRAGEA